MKAAPRGILALLLLSACSSPSPKVVDAQELAGRRLYQQLTLAHEHFDSMEVMLLMLERHEDRSRVLRLLDLSPGQRVADVGAGIGYFTFPMAQQVGPGGRVDAVDIQQRPLEVLAGRSRNRAINPYDNVHTALGHEDDLGFPAATFDRILVAHLDVLLYPDPLEDTRRFLASCVRALKPGGRLLAVQYATPGHYSSLEAITDKFIQAGLVSSHQEWDDTWNTWYLVFQRRGVGRSAPGRGE